MEPQTDCPLGPGKTKPTARQPLLLKAPDIRVIVAFKALDHQRWLMGLLPPPPTCPVETYSNHVVRDNCVEPMWSTNICDIDEFVPWKNIETETEMLYFPQTIIAKLPGQWGDVFSSVCRTTCLSLCMRKTWTDLQEFSSRSMTQTHTCSTLLERSFKKKKKKSKRIGFRFAWKKRPNQTAFVR